MSQLSKLYQIPFIAFFLFVLASPHQTVPFTPNAPNVCGAISSNTTWSLNNSPYDVCNSGVVVNAAVTLTIDPGVVVQFEPGVSNKLYVLGTVVALGTPTQPITFTAVTTTPGSWGGLNIDGNLATPASLQLDHATINYGGVNGSFGANIYADKAVLTINHSLVENSAGNGIYTTLNTQINVQNSSFIGNGLNALQLNSVKTDLLMTGLSASGNGTNGVRLAGNPTMPGLRHWTNPGIPYIVDGPVANQVGDVLTIDPGSNLVFTASGSIGIAGHLDALGTPTQPITMTGQTKTPGFWRGLQVFGGNIPAVANLDYVTIEYAGNDIHGANIEVSDGQLIVHQSIIRNSLRDGVRFDAGSGGSILQSQITGNGGYGVYNFVPTNAVLAANNWWGDPSGPRSDLPQCPVGAGDKITAGVLFSPVLPSANASVPFPLYNAPNITLTPERWFAPADSTTRVYFDITLRDGNGAPIVGRQVRISTTLGSKFDGGVTDNFGKTRAYITSNAAGDATVSASLDAATSCETALSPQAIVTFTTPINITDLFPNSPAPYFDDNISLNPLPVVSGITETITARLTNPLTTTITVDVAFNFVQSSIGLQWAPITPAYTGLVIQPKSSILLPAKFMPLTSGHFCVQVNYSITQIGKVALKVPLAGSQLKQWNENSNPGTPLDSNSKDSLNKADKSWKIVKKVPGGAGLIQQEVADGWWGWVKDTASKVSQALGFDPARQDYTTPTMPVWHTFPHVQPNPNFPPERATALNDVSDALLAIDAYGTAATTALDRYAGASAAGDMTWASAQSNEMLYYEHQLGSAMVTYADKLDTFVTLLQTEGVTQTAVTVNDVIAYQTRLATTGFTDQEKADAHQAGKSEADIEAMRQEIIASNPADIAGDLLTIYKNEAAVARETGNAILNPMVFNPGIHVSGGLLAPQQGALNTMAQVYNLTTSFPLANTTGATEQVSISTRRIDLPADWTVDVSPVLVSLNPGQQITVTLNVRAGAPVPQGIVPRLAVEAYNGTQLLGGIVFDIVVPRYAPFDGNLVLYMPMLRK